MDQQQVCFLKSRCKGLSHLSVMVGFIVVNTLPITLALLLLVSHSQVTGDHLSVVKQLFSEFVVAKKGATKLVLFTPVIY